MKGNVSKRAKTNPFEHEDDTEVDAVVVIDDPPLRRRALTLPYGARFGSPAVTIWVGLPAHGSEP